MPAGDAQPMRPKGTLISEYACEVLRVWNKEQASKSSFVVPSLHRSNQPISTVNTASKATLKRAGVPPFPICNLRYVFCTRCAARDAAHKSRNQAALPVGNYAAGAASDGEVQQEGLRRGRLLHFRDSGPNAKQEGVKADCD